MQEEKDRRKNERRNKIEEGSGGQSDSRKGNREAGRRGRNGTSGWVETSCLITNELLMN